MNGKIGLPDLTRAIAAKSNLDIKVCDAFLRELFSIIAKTLVSGESVKVKGIGTFKSIEVEQRKSVNVNTGQEMLIPGHRKVSFTPDKALAEGVNAPFAMFDAVELADDMTEQMLDEAEMEETPLTDSVLVPADTQISESQSDSEGKSESESEPESESEVLIDTEKESDAEVGIISEVCSNSGQDNECEQTQDIASETESDIEEEEISPQPVTYTQVKSLPENKVEPYIYEPEDDVYVRKSHFGKGFITGIICTVALVAIIIITWRFIAPDSLASISEEFTGVSTSQTQAQPNNQTSALSEKKRESQTPAINKPTADTTSITPQQKAEIIDVPTQMSDADAAVASKTINEDKAKKSNKTSDEPKAYSDKITKKRYLTTMAREYYGNYHLWPLIYDYNKGLGHPDRIRPGTKILVPSLQTLGIDPTNPATIKQAKNRSIEIYKSYR